MHQARREVAALLNCAPDEVVFTSGATEANNLVLKGVALERGRGPDHHRGHRAPCGAAPCLFLDSLGFKLTILPVDAQAWWTPRRCAGP